MYNDLILDDFILSVIDQGITGVKNNDLSAVVTSLDFINTEIDKRSQQQDQSFYFGANENIIANQIVQSEVLGNYGKLFNFYKTYLQQTNGQTPLVTWLGQTNQNYGEKPITLIEYLQPNWFTGQDFDNDGQIDFLIEARKLDNTAIKWYESNTPSATLYSKLRNAVSGGLSGAPSNITPRSTSSIITQQAPMVSSAVMAGAGSSADCSFPKFSFKIEQTTNPGAPKRNHLGFSINPACSLSITLYKCCPPSSAPTELFNVQVQSKLFWKISECDNGQGLYIRPTGNTPSIGKMQYLYYYDMKDVINEIYRGLTENYIVPGDSRFGTIYEKIMGISTDVNPFVESYDINMCTYPGLTRRASFYNPTSNPPTGFIVNLPNAIKELEFRSTPEPKIKWYTDATDTVNIPNAMTFIDNFFLMAGKNTSLQYNFNSVISTNSSTLSGYYNELNSQTVTSLLPANACGGTVQQCGTDAVIDAGTRVTSGTTKPAAIVNTSGVDVPGYGLLNVFHDPNKGDCDDPFYWRIEVDSNVYGNDQYTDYPEIQGKIRSLPGGDYVEDNGLISEYRTAETNRDTSRINQLRLFLEPFLPLSGFYKEIPVGIPGSSEYAPRTQIIPNNPCLVGSRERYAWRVKRRQRSIFKLFCIDRNGSKTEINYTKPGSAAYNYMVIMLQGKGLDGKQGGPFFGYPEKESNGKYKVTNGNYFYSLGEVFLEISNSYFDRYTDIKFQPSIACEFEEQPVYEWRIDVDNPCGCDEIEIKTNYVVYPQISYKDSLTGDIVFSLAENQRKTLDPRIPAPAPGTTEAKYGLTVGQQLTGNRRPKIDCFQQTGEGKPHHPFLFGTDVLTGIRKSSIKGLFNTSQSLECYYTGSNQSSASKDYYYEITDCDTCTKTSYFAVAYGNYKGSGSIASGYESDDSPTRAIYSQYRLLALDPQEKYFKFYATGSENTSDDVYVINFYRTGLSDKLDTGNFEINLAALSGSGIVNNEHTGSKVKVSGSNPVVLSLIDNSSQFDDENSCSMDDPMYSYYIVSGSLNDGIHSSGTGSIITNQQLTTYGHVYPNLGVIVIDGSKLNSYLNFNTVSGSSVAGDNAFKLHTAISGAAVVGKPMRARNVKHKTTNHYFVRIPSAEANYSNNPTYVIDEGSNKGKIKNTCLVENPMTYITSVGLYNTKSELLAIAKLSRPIKKTKENDVLIKIRLNW